MNYVPLNIADQDFLKDPALITLMELLNSSSGNEADDNAKIVGGAVRDALFNIYWNRKRSIGDIDIASKLTPEENTKILEEAGIKVIPTGLKHGTITAVIDDKPFEITTLRRDIKPDGRHSEIEYTDSWEEDAKRRDFTINAFYLDMKGNILDPVQGFKDLKAGRVRFIGTAKNRIKEDALRILRFFRFSSEIDANEIDKDGLNACIELKPLIRDLSGERIWQEFSKILLSRNADKVIPILARQNIMTKILPQFRSYDDFLTYIRGEDEFGYKNVIGRLACLLARDENGDEKCADKTAAHLKLSNKERATLKAFLDKYKDHEPELRKIRKKLYKRGKDVVIYNLIRHGRMDPLTFAYINQYDIPEFPVQGRDLINKGWKAGREMGAELKRLEKLWIQGDFDSSHLSN